MLIISLKHTPVTQNMYCACLFVFLFFLYVATIIYIYIYIYDVQTTLDYTRQKSIKKYNMYDIYKQLQFMSLTYL